MKKQGGTEVLPSQNDVGSTDELKPENRLLKVPRLPVEDMGNYVARIGTESLPYWYANELYAHILLGAHEFFYEHLSPPSYVCLQLGREKKWFTWEECADIPIGEKNQNLLDIPVVALAYKEYDNELTLQNAFFGSQQVELTTDEKITGLFHFIELLFYSNTLFGISHSDVSPLNLVFRREENGSLTPVFYDLEHLRFYNTTENAHNLPADRLLSEILKRSSKLQTGNDLMPITKSFASPGLLSLYLVHEFLNPEKSYEEEFTRRKISYELSRLGRYDIEANNIGNLAQAEINCPNLLARDLYPLVIIGKKLVDNLQGELEPNDSLHSFFSELSTFILRQDYGQIAYLLNKAKQTHRLLRRFAEL